MGGELGADGLQYDDEPGAGQGATRSCPQLPMLQPPPCSDCLPYAPHLAQSLLAPANPTSPLTWHRVCLPIPPPRACTTIKGAWLSVPPTIGLSLSPALKHQGATQSLKWSLAHGKSGKIVSRGRHVLCKCTKCAFCLDAGRKSCYCDTKWRKITLVRGFGREFSHYPGSDGVHTAPGQGHDGYLWPADVGAGRRQGARDPGA